MTGFRGHNQSAGTAGRKGPIPQRKLLLMLKVLIDTCRDRGAGRERDEARRLLREVMATANWDTPYVRRNLGSRRCRYLLGLGYPVPIEDATRSTIDRLNEWREKRGSRR